MKEALRAVRAVEDFSHPGQRALIFANAEGEAVDEVPFASDRMSLLYGDRLYDWFGQEVKLGNPIRRVIQPYGFQTNGSDKNGEHEVFIVELESGRLTLAHIEYDKGAYECAEMEASGLSFVRAVIATQNRIFQRPSLVRYAKLDFGRIDHEALRGTCFEQVQKPDRSLPSLLLDCDMHSDATHGRHATIISTPAHGHRDAWMYNYVVEAREDIFTVSRKAYDWLGPQYKDYCPGYATYLVGDLEIDKRLGKISAEHVFPRRKDGVTRVSTDTEVLEYTSASSGFYWYYDP